MSKRKKNRNSKGSKKARTPERTTEDQENARLTEKTSNTKNTKNTKSTKNSKETTKKRAIPLSADSVSEPASAGFPASRPRLQPWYEAPSPPSNPAARFNGLPADNPDPRISPWPAPRTPAELQAFLLKHFDLHIPSSSAPDAAGPMEYLTHTFFEGGDSWDHVRVGGTAPRAPARRPRPAGPFDCLVWANRGGGKTFLGAVATMLDLVFKHGIEIRILAGSMDQSLRMHAHLRRFFERDCLASMVRGRITDRRLRLKNDSEVELLAQSQTSVRGTRVQKLRCDEVELFRPEVWDAAQLTTRARHVKVPGIGTIKVRAWVECLSTMHLAHGLMHRLVEEAREGKRRLFKWGVVDVLEKCGDDHKCHATPTPPLEAEPGGGSLSIVGRPVVPGPGDIDVVEHDCPLLPECAGRAKGAHQAGHMGIDDAIAMKSRVSLATWEAEMLCLRPSRSNSVLPEFDPKVHVVEELPRRPEEMEWVGGMDFGSTGTTVILWAAVDPSGVLWIADEYSCKGQLMDDHARALQNSPWPRPKWIAADPAGNAANSQTGRGDILFLRRAGFQINSRKSGVFAGLNLVRARLRPAYIAGGGPRLFVLSRCRVLIESMVKYHYNPRNPETSEPVKDGPDHAVDALRYMVLHLDERFPAATGQYA